MVKATGGHFLDAVGHRSHASENPATYLQHEVISRLRLTSQMRASHTGSYRLTFGKTPQTHPHDLQKSELSMVSPELQVWCPRNCCPRNCRNWARKQTLPGKSLATGLKRKRRALNDMHLRTPFACNRPEAQAKGIERYASSNALRLRFRLVSPLPAHSDGKSGAPIQRCSTPHGESGLAEVASLLVKYT